MDNPNIDLQLFKIVDDLATRMVVSINSGEDTYEVKREARDKLKKLLSKIQSKN